MYIEKEPPKTAKEQKVKKAIEKEPAEPAKSKKKEELKVTQGYAAQTKVASPRRPESAQPESRQDPVGDLRKLLREMNLPEKLAPQNVEDFSYDPASGTLVIHLKNAFSKQFDAENTVTFEKTITGTLKPGALTGITGLKRGSATIISITRSRPGMIAITGKLGPFSRTFEFREEQIPSLP